MHGLQGALGCRERLLPSLCEEGQVVSTRQIKTARCSACGLMLQWSKVAKAWVHHPDKPDVEHEGRPYLR